MAEVSKESIRERLGNIDQIRDILMGPHLREYDTRIAQLESDLSLMRQDLRDRIDEAKNSFAVELRAAVESLDKRLKAISLTSSEETFDLRQQVDRMNKKFANTVEVLNDGIDKQTNSLRNELAEARNRLQEDVKSLRDQIFDELDRQFTALKQGKVSKDDMAEILFELGMRMKGAELVRQLKEAAETEDAVAEVYSSIAVLEDD
jgi:DNA anti-recombination protein RmuC